MDDRQSRHVAQSPAAAAQAPRQVDVLAVHEDARLESSGRVERRAPEQRGRAADPRRVERRGVVGLRMLVRDLPQFPRRHPRVVAARKRDQRREGSRLEDAILVQHEQERRVAARSVAVVPAAEADIGGRGHDVDARERAAGERRQRADPFGGAGLGAVVVDQDADVEPGGLLGDAGAELREQVEVGPKGDDRKINRGHGARASAGDCAEAAAGAGTVPWRPAPGRASR